MSELTVTGLTKRFDDHLALDDVALHAEEGELLTLLGPSGCGKSTTLWSIAGLHRPDAGTVGIGGRTVVDVGAGVFVPPEDRECGVVFQTYAIWPHLTVADNVGYPLRLRRVNGRAKEQRVAEVLELVELGDLAHRYPHQLSGGQQQRVALARALAHPPRLLLLDEPFSNLDAKLRERARVWFRALQREVGVTTVFVTHDQDEALSLSDRVAVMCDGVIRQVDTPHAVYQQPADLFVADFLGTVNLLDGTVGSTAGDLVEVAVPGLRRPVAATPAQPLAAGAAVTIAVRPEQIQVGGDDAVPARVVDRVYLGDHHRYRVELGPNRLTIQTTAPLEDTDQLMIQIPPGTARAFAKEADDA